METTCYTTGVSRGVLLLFLPCKNPLVTYFSPGVYSVILTVTNLNGSDIKSIHSYIIVGIGTQQIVSEGFETGSFPPPGWTLEDAGNDGINWFRSNAAGGFGNSSASIAFDNYNNDAQGKKDQSRLPVLDLTPFSSAMLTLMSLMRLMI